MASRTTDKAAGPATGGDKAASAKTAIETEEVRSEAGVTVHVEGLGAAAVALGEALAADAGPVVAGPGVGAAQIAQAVDGPAIRTTRVDVDAVRHEGGHLGHDGHDGLAAYHASLQAAGQAARTTAVATRSGRDDILPLGRPSLDPDTVPGRRMATAAAQVRRDGRSYAPGETFPIDFRAHRASSCRSAPSWPRPGTTCPTTKASERSAGIRPAIRLRAGCPRSNRDAPPMMKGPLPGLRCRPARIGPSHPGGAAALPA